VLAPPDALGDTFADVLTDPDRLRMLRAGALAWAASLTWDASALGITTALHTEVVAAQRRRG
jgi:hypothetical protein